MHARRLGSSLVRRTGLRVGKRMRALEWRVVTPLQVLAYHRIATPACDPWNLAVSPGRFDEQLTVLGNLGTLVSLGDELRGGPGRLSRRPRFAITFDDGYVDNLTAAVPVLERHDVPATVFIPTAFIGARSFWWDRMAMLVFQRGVTLSELGAALSRAGVPVKVDVDAPPSREEFHASLHARITWLTPRAIDDVLDRVTDDLAIEPLQPDGRPMTAPELREVARHPLITIGAHGRRHLLMTRLTSTAALDELKVGNRQLDALLGREHRVLAYPHGDANRKTATLAHGAGFTHAMTTVDRPISVLDRRLLLPRRHPMDVGGDEFSAWLAAN